MVIPIKFGSKIMNIDYIGIIQGKLENTLTNYIDNNNIKYEDIKPIIIKIARKLQNLWKMYNFNHNDFHINNIMYIRKDISSNPSWRLIDFGTSILTIKGKEMRPSNNYAISTPSKDMAELVRSLKHDNYINKSDDIPIFIHNSEVPISSKLILDNFNNIEPYIVDNADCESIALMGGGEEYSIKQGNCYGSIAIAALLVASKNKDDIFTIKMNPFQSQKTPFFGNHKICGGRMQTKKNKKMNKNIFSRKNNSKIDIKSDNSSKYIYTCEHLDGLSVENLYTSIRFHVFKDKSNKILKELFLKMVRVPILHKKLIPLVCESLNTHNFKILQYIVDTYQINDIEEQLVKQGYTKNYTVDIERIIDIYFKIKDRNKSLCALIFFIFFGGTAQEAYDAKFKRIESFEEIDSHIPNGMWNSFII